MNDNMSPADVAAVVGNTDRNYGFAYPVFPYGGGYGNGFGGDSSWLWLIIILALFADGVQIAGTEMDATIATAGDWENISFDKKIRVCCKGSVNLSINSVPTTTFSGTGTPVITDTEIPILKNVEISITRLTGN